MNAALQQAVELIQADERNRIIRLLREHALAAETDMSRDSEEVLYSVPAFYEAIDVIVLDIRSRPR